MGGRDPRLRWSDGTRMTLPDRVAYDLARDQARLSRVKSSYRLRRNHR